MIMCRELSEEEILVIEKQHWKCDGEPRCENWSFDALGFAYELFEAARIQQTQTRNNDVDTNQS